MLRFNRQDFVDDAVDGFEAQPTRCEIDLAGRRDDIRLLTDVQDERLTLSSDDGLKQ